MGHGRILVMSFGLGGNHGDGISKDGNTYSSSWYLNGPDEFVKLIPGHYDPLPFGQTPPHAEARESSQGT